MGTALGFYFRLSKADANRVRRDLADLAKELGYTATRGPTVGEGNPAELLVAIASGEVALVLLPDEHRQWASEWLCQRATEMRKEANDFRSLGIAEALEVIARALDEPEVEVG